MTSPFKGLDLVDRVPEELWTEVCDIVQEAVKTIPKKKKCKKAKWLSEEALQIAEKRREAKGREEKEESKMLLLLPLHPVKGKGEKIYPSECRVPKTSKER